jgi:predicted dithiol-disulfide oxidoreductase (DUF899 family)
MFGPEYTAGCPSCSAIADGFDGSIVHVANHDITLGRVSRAPLANLQAYKRRMGWSFPWASSFESDFSYDFHVSHTEGEWQSEPSSTTSARWPFGLPRRVPCSPSSRRALERTSQRTGEKGLA